jgi:hypothetical protein
LHRAGAQRKCRCIAVGIVPEFLHAVQVGDGVLVQRVAVPLRDARFAGEIPNLIVGVIFRAVRPTRATAGGGVQQPIEAVVVERLRLRAAGFQVGDRLHVAHGAVHE